ncbi:hypothetical protein Afil01_60130 [Actinorhabdospora filicis]|uniref:Methyltransferase type 11 domain-containing protein n=1 Tax=Actinorhabdospora filicis TaxID=1785913 RepID=A0A9W6SUX6_9ACTN|nr:class I SAM-dependent methyltransferase [Actinorhabdospora filicis]GLZ81206.1 hypothetical protein Afil01_60130 [Actinorhabdospora filicis]
MSGARNIGALTRVYSDVTWRVYEELDRSLGPRGPDWLFELAGRYLHPGAVIMDAGCRDAGHLIRLVTEHGATGVGVEPVAVHAEWARAAVRDAGLAERIDIRHTTMDATGQPDGSVDLIWCRDVLPQVDPLVPALRGLARALRPGGHLIVHTTVTTALLRPDDAAMLARHMGVVPANLSEDTLTAGFTASGLAVAERDEIGSEWREHAEERHRPASTALLRLARLRRRREAIAAEHGEDVYRHVEANLHWDVLQLLGRLSQVVYVLRAA